MPPRKGSKPLGGLDPEASPFIMFNNPADHSWRSTVRSHAAIARHAAARRRRVLQYQKQAAPSEVQDRQDQLQVVSSPESLCQIRSVDPFDSLATPTTRFECFLMDNYINLVIPNAGICIKAEAEMFQRTGMRMKWIQATIVDGIPASIFLTTCRALIQLGAPGEYQKKILEYRNECILFVNNAITREGASPSATTIITTIALALDSLNFGDIGVTKRHCDAAKIMAKMKCRSQNGSGSKSLDPLAQWTKFVTDRILLKPRKTGAASNWKYRPEWHLQKRRTEANP